MRLPHIDKDSIARQSEGLVLKYNPDWHSAGYDEAMPTSHDWAKDHFDLRTFHVMQMSIPFTRESWRGRIQSCRGIGAALPTAEDSRMRAQGLDKPTMKGKTSR